MDESIASSMADNMLRDLVKIPGALGSTPLANTENAEKAAAAIAAFRQALIAELQKQPT